MVAAGGGVSGRGGWAATGRAWEGTVNRSPSAAPRSGARRRWALGLGAVLATLALVLATLPAAAAAPKTAGGRELKAKPLTVTTRVVGAKSASGQLAKTDKSLLGLKSSQPVNVVVKLDYDSLAAYRGGVKGYVATSPSVTRRKLSTRDATVRRYAGYVAGVEASFKNALRARLPDARTGRSLRTVYGGVAVKVAGNRIADLLRVPGVAAVQKDTPEKPLTDASPAFIGAPTLYSQLGGSATAGSGVIVGVLDTGAWPEHPSYVDHGNLPAPPPKADGTPRTCDFGDNPLTPAPDVFACNNKLISGQPFLDTYNAVFPGTEVYPDTARDSNGHGTHTSTTAAGGPVAHADPLGVDRGAIHGIAPGAHLAVYKVCGAQGCFSSDSAAAVAQAILDGVQAINFSISGGTDPFTDPVELAFLDAYAAGVLVSASAGNEGPGAGTVNHLGPWVTTVAASTQRRAFQSTLSLAGGGASESLTGASITGGVASPLPVVLASAAPYSDELCSEPAAPGTFTGKVVGCLRGGIARVAKGFNVFQGGAAGMILYNPPGQADVETDNHWLPTVHLNGDDGETFTAFVGAHPDTTAAFTAGQKVQGQGDVMADFSSRGPGGDWLKPDITAPGVQILAGMTPTPESTDLGPPNQLFQAIAGTSMSSPHIAGSAALLFARHPTWSPGQVKSALETTATTSVVKEDGTTPADPFDLGGGRVDLNVAGNPGLTFDESAADYVAAAVDVLGRIDLNTPSVNAPTMPGQVSTSRVARNVSGRTLTYRVSTDAPAGTEITVTPSSFTLAAGATIRLRIRISAPNAAPGQYFGQINLDRRGGSDLHLPVAFNRAQGQVSLNQTCDPTTIPLETGRSTCEVTIQNNSLQDTSVVSRSRLTSNLRLTAVNGATQVSPREAVATANLTGRELASPTIAPGASPAGYIPLDAFGITPIAIGDEEAVNLTGLAAPFRFADQDYDTIGVTSNGYSVAGGVTSGSEIQFIPQSLPDPAPPNSVLAPFWTDLDGTGAPGIFAAELSDQVNTWLVIEWRVNVFGTTSQRVFQHWLGEGGAEDISFVYDPANLPGPPTAGFGLTVGAENQAGSAGDQIAPTTPETPPTEDLRVTSTPGTPGETLTYSYELKGVARGTGEARTSMTTPLVRGTTQDFDQIIVQ
jgi:subtilisin family serine protease